MSNLFFIKLKKRFQTIQGVALRIYTFLFVLASSLFAISLLPENIKDFINNDNNFKVLAFFATLLGLAAIANYLLNFINKVKSLEKEQANFAVQLNEFRLKEKKLLAELRKKEEELVKDKGEDVKSKIKSIKSIKEEIVDIQNNQND